MWREVMFLECPGMMLLAHSLDPLLMMLQSISFRDTTASIHGGNFGYRFYYFHKMQVDHWLSKHFIGSSSVTCWRRETQFWFQIHYSRSKCSQPQNSGFSWQWLFHYYLLPWTVPDFSWYLLSYQGIIRYSGCESRDLHQLTMCITFTLILHYIGSSLSWQVVSWTATRSFYLQCLPSCHQKCWTFCLHWGMDDVCYTNVMYYHHVYNHRTSISFHLSREFWMRY